MNPNLVKLKIVLEKINKEKPNKDLLEFIKETNNDGNDLLAQTIFKTIRKNMMINIDSAGKMTLSTEGKLMLKNIVEKKPSFAERFRSIREKELILVGRP